MPYVTSAERIGIEKGRKEGLQEGLRNGLLKAIELGLGLKFGDKGLKILPRIRKVTEVETLRAIVDALKQDVALHDLRKLWK
jgi:hypothetical protein